MLYLSTRGGEKNVSFSSAVLNGLANDGGLYVPENFPFFSENLEFSIYSAAALSSKI